MSFRIKKFAVGTVTNPLKNIRKSAHPRYSAVTLDYPSRLNAMALDPSKIVISKQMRYTPGEIIFKVKLYRRVTVLLLTKKHDVIITPTTKRPSLVKHAALIMRKALATDYGFKIDINNSAEIRHAGLGSSSGLIAAVASGIHELFGRPLPPDVLVRYLAQNHGEEIGGDDDYLSPVQCIGGSAAGGQYDGGVLVLAGEGRVIASASIGRAYKVIIGIPVDFQELDAQTLLSAEAKKFPQFVACGVRYGPTIAYRLVHEGMPGLVVGDIRPLGNLIYDYRFKMGSIENCSYSYPRLSSLAKKIAILKGQKAADVLALSSVGPAFFALTKKPTVCANIFRASGLKVRLTEIENDKYKVVWRKKL